MTLSSKQLRKILLQERRALSNQTIKNLSRLINNHLKSASFFIKSERIAFYLPYNGEVDTLPILKKAAQMGKQCYLPVLNPLKHNRLWFAQYFLDDNLKKNLYGILEPEISQRKIISPWSLDLIFLPLVAFDNEGNRLGMGGGYYDRTLAFKNRLVNRQNPKLVGLAYEFQRQDALFPANWDIRLENVVTELKIYSFP